MIFEEKKFIFCYTPVHMTKAYLVHSFGRIASFLFLALVCCGQVYQSAHLHHIHGNDPISFEISSTPQDPAEGDASAHHHHAEQSSNEHEHDYENKVDWNVARSKSITKVSFEAQALLSHVYTVPPVDFVKSTPCPQISSYKKDQYVPFLIIRGPPHLV